MTIIHSVWSRKKDVIAKVNTRWQHLLLQEEEVPKKIGKHHDKQAKTATYVDVELLVKVWRFVANYRCALS